MPVDLTALLIVIIAIFPGSIGNKIYKNSVGTDWQEKEYQTILRISGFSVVGVMLYSLIGNVFGWTSPTHLFPSTYTNITPNNFISTIVYPYIGHLVFGSIAGLFGVFGAKSLAYFSKSSAHPGCWDDFIRRYVMDHWVIVSLKSGEVYAGKIKNADISTSRKERDIILEEPCQFDKTTKKYTAINYQHMFFPAEILYSIAVVPNTDDKRIMAVGQDLFSQGETKNE
jgi:Family of unknown function (DUF6338)